MDTKFLQILKALGPDGVGVYKNITSVLLPWYPNVDNKDEHQVHQASRNIYSLLAAMKKDGLIDVENYSLGSGNSTNGYTWLTNTTIKAAITARGNNLLEAELNKSVNDRLNESLIETNQSTRDANDATISNISFQKKFGNRSLLLAAISTAFILATLIYQIFFDHTSERLNEIKKEIQSNRDKLDAINGTLKQIDSSLQDLKRDTIPIQPGIK